MTRTLSTWTLVRLRLRGRVLIVADSRPPLLSSPPSSPLTARTVLVLACLLPLAVFGSYYWVGWPMRKNVMPEHYYVWRVYWSFALRHSHLLYCSESSVCSSC